MRKENVFIISKRKKILTLKIGKTKKEKREGKFVIKNWKHIKMLLKIITNI